MTADASPDASHEPDHSRVGQVASTFVRPNSIHYVRRQSPFVWSGLLTQAVCDDDTGEWSASKSLELHCGVFSIGRGSRSQLRLSSRDVSRDHARIHRRETDFYLEDCNSAQGTYLNGDRVLWCRLSDGDVLDFGARLQDDTRWYFDRVAVRQARSAATWENSTRLRPEHVPDDQLIVTFWGCRGSIPTPGSHTEVYGGNTTCVEVQYGENLFILDAGTGIRALGSAWAQRFGEAELDINLLFTHLHWDHIQGFPFLAQAYDPRHRLRIIGADREAGTIREMLSNQMQGLYFPIPMEAMQAQFTFTNPGDEFDVGGVRITKMLLPHPGGAFAYKFTVDTGTFVFATDCELNAVCPNASEVKETAVTGRQFPADLLEFVHGVDLLVIDCQYSDEQYRQRIGWGHNSVSTVIDFCHQAEVRAVAFTHHDPASTDEDVRQMVRHADEVCRMTMGKSAVPRIFAAREQMMVAASKDW